MPTTQSYAHPNIVCPKFHYAVELIGRRWTGAILRAMFAGETRFGAIATAVPNLSDRMLAERLKELEREGIVERRVESSKPVRVRYHLTPKGQEVEPVLESCLQWAERWV
jgi:DNA-binding HxlR family transcriptional regulator